MATQTVVISGSEPVDEANIASQSTRLEKTQPAGAEPWVNASQWKTQHQEPTLMAGRGGADPGHRCIQRNQRAHRVFHLLSNIFWQAP